MMAVVPGSASSSPAIVTDEYDVEQRQTLWVGGINEKVTEEILYELFVNAGPLMSVRIPVDKESKRPKNFAFVRFQHEESIPFAVNLFRDVRLFGQSLRMQNRTTGVGMPNNQNRFQQSPAQNQGGFNGYQRPAAPQVPVWQNQNQNRFQGGMNFQHPASGFQAIPNQGFGIGGQLPFGAEGNDSNDDNVVPHQGGGHHHQHHGHHHHQGGHHQHQQRRDQQMRQSRDEQRHSHHHHHHHHRSQSERSRGNDRGRQDNHNYNRDRSYDHNRRRY